MPNGTGNSRNFQISGKKDKSFEMSFQKRSVPSAFVPEFPGILVQWIAPYTGQLGLILIGLILILMIIIIQ